MKENDNEHTEEREQKKHLFRISITTSKEVIQMRRAFFKSELYCGVEQTVTLFKVSREG